MAKDIDHERGRRLTVAREHFSDLWKIKNQEAFAHECGFHPKNWSRWEQGESIPWDKAIKLCEKCPGLTLDYIYRERLGLIMPTDLAADLGRRLERSRLSVRSKIS